MWGRRHAVQMYIGQQAGGRSGGVMTSAMQDFCDHANTAKGTVCSGNDSSGSVLSEMMEN